MSTEISRTSVNENLPAFMQQEQTTGMELVQRYIVPPRIKVVQPMRASDAYEEFDEGDTVLTPQRTLLVPKGHPFHFVPLLFYPEWLTLNPLQMKETLPMIRERTIDPTSVLARKSRDKNTWFEECPENKEFKLRNVESLVFLIELLGVQGMEGMPVAMTFSKGEHSAGSRFCALLKMRSAPIFGCVFEAVVPEKKRKNAKGQWYGIDVSNPSQESEVAPFVQSADEYERFRSQHQSLFEQYREGLIHVDVDEEEPSEPVDDGKY